MIFGVHPHGLKTFRYDGFQPWFQATYYKVVPPQVINGLYFIIPLTVDISPTKTIVTLDLFAPTERYLGGPILYNPFPINYLQPIGSMYDIYANIWGILMVNVSIYTYIYIYHTWILWELFTTMVGTTYLQPISKPLTSYTWFPSNDQPMLSRAHA
jgi:hypothetical protein